MMSVLQNAFANSSSSPHSKQDHGQPWVCAAHAVALALVLGLCGLGHGARGLVVGLGVFGHRLVCARASRQPLWVLVFGVLGAALLAVWG